MEQGYERLTPRDLMEAITFNGNEDMSRIMLYAARLWKIENEIERLEREYVINAAKAGDRQ